MFGLYSNCNTGDTFYVTKILAEGQQRGWSSNILPHLLAVIKAEVSNQLLRGQLLPVPERQVTSQQLMQEGPQAPHVGHLWIEFSRWHSEMPVEQGSLHLLERALCYEIGF